MTRQGELLAQALESAPLLIFVADESMRYVGVNEYACDVLGYTREEMLGLRVTDIATEDRSAGDYQRMIEAGWLSGRSWLRCKDGTELAFQYRAGETEVDGKATYVAVGWII
jgi:PAS domain S-box-containing protein